MDAAWLDQVSFVSSGSPVPPTILSHPMNQSAPVGAQVQFTVTANGSAPLSYQWKKNNTDLPGATSESLSLTNIQPSDAASYTVAVSNSVGYAISDAAQLTVYLPPVVQTEPVSTTVGNGGDVLFQVKATGTPPFTYQWRQNNEIIPGATNSTLWISSAASTNAGSYSVTITGPGGWVESSVAQLTLVDLQMFAGVRIRGTVGNRYRIEYTNSIQDPVRWEFLQEVTLSKTDEVFIDLDSPGLPRRFYRTLLIQP